MKEKRMCNIPISKIKHKAAYLLYNYSFPKTQLPRTLLLKNRDTLRYGQGIQSCTSLVCTP